MLDKIKRALREIGATRRQLWVVAVSGGADSTALLLALHELGYRPVVAHLNHGLRGRAANADAAFVKSLAARLDLKCETRRAPVAEFAKAKKVSVEMAARELRYEFLRDMARKYRAAGMFTAHNADDQAETLLLRLCRGAGLRGLAGIVPDRKIAGVRVARPMLDVTHEEAIEFLRARGQKWREDVSNRDDVFLRNRIRNEILPLLAKRIHPSVSAALSRTARVLAADEAILDEVAHAAMRKAASGEALKASALRTMHPALQRRVVLAWLTRHTPEMETVDFDSVERVLKLAGQNAGTAVVDIAGGDRVVREYDVLRFAKEASPPRAWKLRIKRGRGILRPEEKFGEFPTEASLSAGRVGDKKLEVREWRPGDRMRPFGMKGSKKLQDIFTDAKAPRAKRAKLPVVACGNEIVWLPGYRIADGWQVEHPRAACIRVQVVAQT